MYPIIYNSSTKEGNTRIIPTHIQKNTLSSKFDITEQIYQTNKTYKIDASFQHVYGYQDTKSGGEMLIGAKLNGEADRLAGQYQDDLDPYSPITHMYPLSPAVLEEINGVKEW